MLRLKNYSNFAFKALFRKSRVFLIAEFLKENKIIHHINNYNIMVSINVKDNESIDKALKRFKKKFEKTGNLREYRGRTYFQRPSITRRAQMIKAAYREQMHAKNNY